MKITNLFKEFFEKEKTSAIILIACTIFSLLLANSSFANSYNLIWNHQIAHHFFTHWINDGLMTIFFLLIGLELEREIYHGELSNIKEASLPFFAALGGMILPTSIYLLFTYNTPAQSGYGIPMATDIAFAIGLLALLGARVPVALKVFLTALAVIDDLGAILVIAIFYTKTIIWPNLALSLGIFFFLLLLNRLKIRNLIPYLFLGIFMWYFMLKSGIHATISGVLLAFAIPFGNGDKKSTSYILQHFLHKPVAFFILPLFALANTNIKLNSNFLSSLEQNYSLGIIFGLFIGKPLGITLFSALAIKLGLAKLPNQINWKILFSTGFLAAIGFTMSIFITLLAFENSQIINNAKIAILLASIISGLLGLFSLDYFLDKQPTKNPKNKA
jgi:Na+:H+ antiporter, NhaA family